MSTYTAFERAKTFLIEWRLSNSDDVTEFDVVLQYFEENAILAFKETRPFVVIDSAACVSFQVLGEFLFSGLNLHSLRW